MVPWQRRERCEDAPWDEKTKTARLWVNANSRSAPEGWTRRVRRTPYYNPQCEKCIACGAER
eukprot:59355-Alexandrium_andersonii.AAC.1